MTVICANCDKPADYTHTDPGVNSVDYCASCMPSWLRDRAARGEYPLVPQEDAKPVATKKASTKPAL